ncbi:MAG: hypothetical protein VX252_08020 [Myxococcota bacterium]|nr:hypothetical protein [Myxococcota bacterium]
MTSSMRWAVAAWIGLTLLVGGAPLSAQVETEEDRSSLNRPIERAFQFAPAGVFLDYTHKKDEWTFLYRYERYSYDGLMSGSQSVSNAQVASQYDVVPLSHLQEIHTFGVMYAPRDRFTLAFLLPYIDQSLTQIDQLAANPYQEQNTDGIGDARLVLMLPFIRNGAQQSQFNVELSFPTGSIRASGSEGQRLPYIMQRGTGTWDVHYGITYVGEYESISWGGQIGGQYRLNENSLGYRLGAVYQASAWLSGELASWLSVSGRFAWQRTGNIHGEDRELDKSLSPLNNNMKQSGTLVQAGPGMNILLPIFGGQRLSVEVLFPLYQDLDGPQLRSDMTLTAGWQWLF